MADYFGYGPGVDLYSIIGGRPPGIVDGDPTPGLGTTKWNPERQEFFSGDKTPKTPSTPNKRSESGGGERSGGDGMSAWGDYLSWQRTNLKDLLKNYREMFPKFLRGWKEDSYADLDKATHDYGEGSLKNLWQRGLGKSPAWVAGSKLDQAGFQEKGGRDIEAMSQQMQMDSISKMAAAVGRPDQGYAQSAQGWNQYQGIMDWQKHMEWQQQFNYDRLYNQYSDPLGSEGLG